MRLVSVIHGPGFGGAHNQLVRLASPLRERHGIESVAVLPEEAGEAAARIEAAGVETVRLPLARLRASVDPRLQVRFLRSLGPDIRSLEQAIRRLEADVVQVHGPTNPQAAIAARRAGAGVAWQLLDTRAPLPLRGAAVPLIARLAGAVTVWGERLVAAHPGAARLGDRLVIVYPPVDLAAFTPSPARRIEARTMLRVVDPFIAVGTISAINPQKGLAGLIEAAGGLPELPPTVIRIIGSAGPAHGSEFKRLQGLGAALNRSTPGGFEIIDPGERVADLIQGLDIFVLSSLKRSEGMPTAILEAMAAGKPVVATDVGAVSELVEHGRTGLLVEPGDPTALAAAIGRLVADPELRRRMGAAGREDAAAKFDLRRLADRHAAAYRLAFDARLSL